MSNIFQLEKTYILHTYGAESFWRS